MVLDARGARPVPLDPNRMVDQPAPAKAKTEKVTPPSPPRVITDRITGAKFERIGYLGEVSGRVHTKWDASVGAGGR